MDIKNFIASGILENYVLNLLSEKERLDVERYAEEYPEIRAEINRIEIALEDYARMNAVPAPVGISAQIEDKLDSLTSNNSSDKGTNSSQLFGWLLGALFLISAYVAYHFYQKNQATELLQQSTSQQLIDLQLACDSTGQENAILQQQLQILRTGSNKIIAMKGTDKAPQALANVIYNQESQKSYLDVQSLPAPPSGKQYQLWAIVNGQPVDMGVFEVVISDGFQEVPFIENAAAFAVTLENRGGSPTPTLEEMVVIGNV